MKHNYIFRILTIFALFGLWSCSQESDFDDRITIGTEHDGVYMGKLSRNISNVVEDFTRKVYVVKERDEHLNLTIPYFPFASDQNEEIRLVDVLATIEEYGGPVTLSSVQNITTNFDQEFAANLEGSIIDGVLSLNVSLVPIGSTDIYEMSFEFTGPKTTDLSSECSIRGFSINNELFIPESTHIFEQSKEIRLLTTQLGASSSLANQVPTINISAGATITPAADQPQDFSQPVLYTVTSEDGIYSKTYTVSLFNRPGVFSFDAWEVANPTTEYEATKYQVPVEQYGFSWQSSNATYAPYMHLSGEQNDSDIPVKPVSHYGVVSTSDAYSGSRAALIETLEMNPNVTYKIPKITGGTLYTGSFDTNLNNYDSQMHYGYPVFYKPLSLKGYYKYQPGADFHQCIDLSTPQETIILSQETDAMRIMVFVYTVQDPYDNDEMLTLSEVLSGSDRIIARGEMISRDRQSTYKAFDIPLVYGEEEAFSYQRNYRVGFFLWSSSKGNLYSGAPGSKLWVDQLQIITE